jgi:membrane protein
MKAPKGSLWTRGGLSWWELGVRLWRQLGEDEVPGRCAELAYYFLFSIFPLLLFLTALLAYLTRLSEGVRWNLFWLIGHLSPSKQVTELLNRTLEEIAARGSGGKLSLGLLASIWVASNGMIAVSRSLNRAFNLEETRPWWLRRLVALTLIVGFAGLIICALGLVFYGGAIATALSEHLSLGPYLVALWHLARWLLVAACLVLSFDMIYNFAPDVGRAKGRTGRRWGTPGAFVGVALFVGASAGFRSYLSYYDSYTRAYGSLGAVIVLLVWFYLTAFSIIMGGEVNSEIARVVDRKTARRKK